MAFKKEIKMSRFDLGLSSIKTEYEKSVAIENERAAFAGDTLAESPFSPIASRAYSSGVSDVIALEKVTEVLEENDLSDIPETSLAAIKTAMESIRHRLMGGKNTNVSIESFSNKNDLNIALEENKNFIQRAWDAIVKFFKGIYDWFAGFFKKKKSDAEVLAERAEKTSKQLSNMVSVEYEKLDLSGAPTLNGVGLKLSDGTVVGKTNSASEDNGIDYNKLITIVKGVLSGSEPLILVTNRYNFIFGSSNVEVKSELMETVKKISDKTEAVFRGMEEAGLENFANKPVNKETITGISSKSLEELIGKSVPITMGSSLEISGNSVTVKKPENNEIEIAMYGGPSGAKKTISILNEQLKDVLATNKECFEFTASMTNKIHDFDKELGRGDSGESEEAVKSMRSKMSMINGVIKLIVLTMNQSLNILRLSIDILESYIAGVALIVNQAKKAQLN